MEQGKDVVIVGHSYGGHPASEAILGLANADGAVAGHGRLSSLVYLSALIPKAGMTVVELLSGAGLSEEAFFNAEVDGYLPPPTYEGTAAMMNGVDPCEAREHMSTLRRQSATSFRQKLKHEGHTSSPTTSVVTLHDQAVTVDYQHMLTDEAVSAGGSKVRPRILNSGHFSMLSHPNELASMLTDIAAEDRKLLKQA